MPTLVLRGRRWVPAIPLKAPIDVRIRCAHEWTECVYDTGQTAWNYFGCIRCGATKEAANLPADGRSWIGRLLCERS